MENTPRTENELNKGEEMVSETQSEQTLSDENTPESLETIAGTDGLGQAKEIFNLKAELAEAKDKYLRLYSEFENFRRRTAKEKLEMVQTANEQLIRSMLSVIDDFERAEKSFQNKNDTDTAGFFLIQNKLKKVFEQYGVKPMDLKQGSEFNADVHEAITQIPAPDEKLKGKIMDVVEKGYLLNDKVIRYAKVVVGN